jgi:hypothetical protein
MKIWEIKFESMEKRSSADKFLPWSRSNEIIDQMTNLKVCEIRKVRSEISDIFFD